MVQTAVHRGGPTATCLLLLGTAIVAAGAQADRFVGTWITDETDHGIAVSLTIGSASTLIGLVPVLGRRPGQPLHSPSNRRKEVWSHSVPLSFSTLNNLFAVTPAAAHRNADTS